MRVEMIQPHRQNKSTALPKLHLTVIALGGVITFVAASLIYAKRTGFLFAAVAIPLIFVPILTGAQYLSVVVSGRWNWPLRWIGILIWVVPSLYLLILGYINSQPKRMFERDVLSPIPTSVSDIYGTRRIGIEANVGYCFACDSNAVSQIVLSRALVLDTNLVYYPPNTQANAPDIEWIANEKISSMARFLNLPVHYLKEPILYQNDGSLGGAPRMQLWVERDQRMAYFFK